jgi:hypothetical protein
VLPSVTVGNYPRLERPDPVHPVEQPHPLETLDVVERRSEGLIDDDLALGAVSIWGLNGGTGGLGEASADDPDRAELEHRAGATKIPSQGRCLSLLE